MKGATKFWVCEKVKDWLVDNPKVIAKELQRTLKDEYKVVVDYKRVYYGKELSLSQLFGDWKECFDNLYTFKEQIDSSCPGNFVVIDHDHHTINNHVAQIKSWLLHASTFAEINSRQEETE